MARTRFERKKVRIEKRGRPRQPLVRPAGEPDQGTSELRRRKRQATTQVDVELTAAGILFGRDLLDRQQYDRLDEVTSLLRLLARNLGPRPDAVAGLWAALTGAMIGRGLVTPASVGPLAPIAQRKLARMLERLDGSRDLVIAIAENRPVRLVAHALAGRLDGADYVNLELLKTGLDRVASKGGGTRR
jgi:hypothetical protein